LICISEECAAQSCRFVFEIKIHVSWTVVGEIWILLPSHRAAQCCFPRLVWGDDWPRKHWKRSYYPYGISK